MFIFPQLLKSFYMSKMRKRKFYHDKRIFVVSTVSNSHALLFYPYFFSYLRLREIFETRTWYSDILCQFKCILSRIFSLVFPFFFFRSFQHSKFFIFLHLSNFIFCTDEENLSLSLEMFIYHLFTCYVIHFLRKC